MANLDLTDTRSIIHPDFMRTVSEFHRNTLIRLYEVTITRNDFNEELRVPRLLDIVFYAYIQLAKGDQEIRRADQTLVSEAYDVSCDGYYPQITVEHLINVQGILHNVLSVRHDDTHTLTMLITEVVNP